MPIYEYRCQECGHELEKLQRMSDDPLTDCPSCGQAQLKRLVSAAAFRLKGGGWYETDFKSGSKKNLVDGGTDGKSQSKTDGKSDSKSANGSKSDGKSDSARKSNGNNSAASAA